MVDVCERICEVEGCGKPYKAKGCCAQHYQRLYLYGRTNLIKNKNDKSCSVEGCETISRRGGMCANHYQMLKKYGRTEKLTNFITEHKLYRIWVDKKVKRILCEEWLDFWKFVEDVGERPEGNYFLERLKEGLFGPDNFEWKLKLEKENDETNKEWHARKWQSRKEQYPDFEIGRHLRQKYGMTKLQYAKMAEEQNNKCAICNKEENSPHVRKISEEVTKSRVRNLAVDHCHTTGRVRGLLCTRCNQGVGYFQDSPTLLQSAIDYLNKHKDI